MLFTTVIEIVMNLKNITLAQYMVSVQWMLAIIIIDNIILITKNLNIIQEAVSALTLSQTTTALNLHR